MIEGHSVQTEELQGTINMLQTRLDMDSKKLQAMASENTGNYLWSLFGLVHILLGRQ